MKYVQISEAVLCDLLDSKSKIIDIKLLVDEYSLQLKEMRMLDRVNNILYSNRFNPQDQEVLKVSSL